MEKEKRSVSRASLREMSKVSRRNEKAYKAFKHMPDYGAKRKCHYNKDLFCNRECKFYEYCSKRASL